MLQADQRLRRTSDIQHLYKTGRPAFHKLLRVSAVPTKLPTPRATVVVSTRVSKKAVDRNRIKRHLRVHLRILLAEVKTPHDIVVVAQAQAAKATPAELVAAVTSTFRKLHLL